MAIEPTVGPKITDTFTGGAVHLRRQEVNEGDLGDTPRLAVVDLVHPPLPEVRLALTDEQARKLAVALTPPTVQAEPIEGGDEPRRWLSIGDVKVTDTDLGLDFNVAGESKLWLNRRGADTLLAWLNGQFVSGSGEDLDPVCDCRHFRSRHKEAGPCEREECRCQSFHFDGRHPAIVHILRYFEYGHLPPHLQDISKPICELALLMGTWLPQSAELTAGLRKLLEAKDCIVRAALDQ